MPPKLAHQLAEQQILKKFEELGYEIKKEDTIIVITNYITTTITINLTRKYYICTGNDGLSFQYISFQEHQLLHELFKCWGWINE